MTPFFSVDLFPAQPNQKLCLLLPPSPLPLLRHESAVAIVVMAIKHPLKDPLPLHTAQTAILDQRLCFPPRLFLGAHRGGICVEQRLENPSDNPIQHAQWSGSISLGTCTVNVPQGHASINAKIMSAGGLRTHARWIGTSLCSWPCPFC